MRAPGCDRGLARLAPTTCPTGAVQRAHRQLLPHRCDSPAPDLVERHGPDDERDRLVAGVAADTRDNRHQRGQRHDCGIASSNAPMTREAERGQEVDRQPWPPIADRLETGARRLRPSEPGAGEGSLADAVRMKSTTASTVTRPTSLPRASTTGAETRSYRSNAFATSPDLCHRGAEMDRNRRIHHELSPATIASATRRDAEPRRRRSARSGWSTTNSRSVCAGRAAALPDERRSYRRPCRHRRRGELVLHHQAGGGVFVIRLDLFQPASDHVWSSAAATSATRVGRDGVGRVRRSSASSSCSRRASSLSRGVSANERVADPRAKTSTSA